MLIKIPIKTVYSAKPTKLTTHDRIRMLVAECILTEPHAKDNLNWAARPQSWYCKKFGISPRTFRNVIRKPPFDGLRVLMDGKIVTLLRVKKPGEPITITHCQRRLQAMWNVKIVQFNLKKVVYDTNRAAYFESQKKYCEKQIQQHAVSPYLSDKKLSAMKAEVVKSENLRTRHQKKALKAKADAQKPLKLTPHQYGCLRGLVQAWGVEHAEKMFGLVLNDWPAFMTGASIEIECEKELEGKNTFKRFLEFPCIPFILRFNYVAFEMQGMSDQQDKKNLAPPLLLKPNLFAAPFSPVC